ncbi:5'-3' exoribonuclease [Impatiens glandulifera]|uniref:5'-3' exoribonuclease n=1 Tax=Impatiens glandulifera TaxID=253017 RepID=UPI001FB07CF6|nr:5'-3' exoribonuclease [Impatiens glandulifera]
MADKKKKKKRGGAKRKMTVEQITAHKSVAEWVSLGHSLKPSTAPLVNDVVVDVHDDDFGLLPNSTTNFLEKFKFEFHSHSISSDGFLSPSKLVERAHRNGVKVLSLTDHDTLSGIPEALKAAQKFGIKIIPGVEISTIFSPREEQQQPGLEEPVHILAYYSTCGPTKPDVFEKFLSNIRDGRYLRARNMLSKLNKLKLPVRWEQVTRIAGAGVAPGRLHVARAMVEAGYVENLKQAFSRYLHDGGPAYSKGSEPSVEDALQMICESGGVSVLAHPWALKNPVPIIRRLKDAGLHGIEVYRSDGKLAVFSDLADAYDLVKLGGSDFHGRGGHGESDMGSVNLPIVAVHEFLKMARPIWCASIKNSLEEYTEDPSPSKLEWIMKFGKIKVPNGGCSNNAELVELCLSSWFTKEERQNLVFDALKLKLSKVSFGAKEDIQVPMEI